MNLYEWSCWWWWAGGVSAFAGGCPGGGGGGPGGPRAFDSYRPPPFYSEIGGDTQIVLVKVDCHDDDMAFRHVPNQLIGCIPDAWHPNSLGPSTMSSEDLIKISLLVPPELHDHCFIFLHELPNVAKYPPVN